MSVVSQRPRRQYEVLHWGHVDLQEYANGRFVSNNNIFTIVFFNTYYHKQINKISISACNETFRQSSDPVYAHTPMRNVGGLRTFNPKLKDSAGGEVNKYQCGKLSKGLLVPPWCGAVSDEAPRVEQIRELVRARDGLVPIDILEPEDIALVLEFITTYWMKCI